MESNIIIGIICAILLVVFLYVITAFNTLVRALNRVKNQWAQIDVQLTRRAELIPNLVECVKGYASHEKSTLEQVVTARAAMIEAGTPRAAMAANAELTSALPAVFALAEAYPDLKANTVFLKLQTDLGDTETKVAFSRQFYNDAVMMYQNKIQQFPRSIVAKIFGFRDRDYYIAGEGDRASVTVDVKAG
ncbi:MAG: LemA family protein [Lachnospiraceae bacterium]|jgi:LemA protein|nr:LemA family protein [Lachnospiraceae bacterium]